MKIPVAIDTYASRLAFLRTWESVLTELEASVTDQSLMIYFFDTEDQQASVAELIRRIGGTWDKRESGSYVYFTHRSSGFETFYNRAETESCVQVPTGRKVTKRVPHTTWCEEEVDEMEWKCEPILSVGKDD